MPSRLLLVRWWVSLLAVLVLPILFFNASSAWAEGSRSLYPNTYPAGGSRANLDIQPGNKYVSKVNRRTFLYVYAQAGEYILLGSRNRNNGGDVKVYDPQSFGTPGDETIPGTANFTCSVTSNGPNYGGVGRGYIASRAEELAGPMNASATTPSGGRFLPCAYQAQSSGIYGVEFTVATSGITPNSPTGSIGTLDVSSNTVSAWDVTVRADAISTVDLDGRLFTYAWAAFTGGNSRPVFSTHYYVTNDGYRYSQDLRGLDPNGYVLYANSFGFLDNGQPLFKNLRGQGTGTVAALVQNIVNGAGLTSQIAQYPIFFSDVSNNAEVEKVLTALNIPLAPPTPTVSNLSFNGHLGSSTTTVGVGGTFTFTTTNTITYQIVVSRNGTDFDPSNVNNAVLTGIASTGTHNINWNGKDNSGVNFPVGGPYTFRVEGHNGDVHFPIIDAENNPGAGPTITRLNGTNPSNKTIYYDDRGYRTRSGNLVGNLNGTLCPAASPAAPTVPASLLGVDSSTNYRDWASGSNANSDCASGSGWGDAKGLDLWTYFSTAPQSNTLTINPIVVDVATSVSAPSTATAGSPVQGTFSFANNGNATANGVTYGLTLSPGLGTVTFGNLPAGTTASYNNATGVVTFGGTPLPVTLGAGQSIPFMTFSYTAPSAGPVVATTTINTTSSDTYPANNTATVSTGIGTVDVSTTVSVPATAAAGSTVNGTFTFANNGANAATIPAGGYVATVDSGTCPQDFQFTSLPTNVTATCSGGTISFTGLPSSLAAGQSFNFGFSYTMPASGSIPINTSISTTSSDANPANNSASGSTMTSMVSISGTVFADIDGSGIQNGSETGTDAGGLNAVIADNTGKVLAVAPVGSNGSWTANVPAGTNYSAYITTASPAVGSTVTPTATLPTGWSVSGENVNGTVDGTPNGILTGINASTTVSGLNFGIQQSADLSLTKTVDKATPVNGDQITYTLTVANAGPAQATGVTVADTLPASKVTFVSASAGCSHSSGVVTCGPASVTAGGDVQFQITVTVTDATGGLSNTEQITAADQPDPDSTPNNGIGNGEDDQATLSTPQPVADLELTNVVNNVTPAVGANVTFTVTLTNQGPDPATDAQVNALLPAGYTLVSATPSSGSYDPITGDWTVGSLPATAGSNTATLILVATVLATGSYDLTAQVAASGAFDPDSIPNNNNAVEDDQQTAAVNPVGPPSATDDAITVPFNTAGTFTNVLSNDAASSGATLDPATLDLDPSTDGIQTTYTVPGQGTFALVTANGVPTGAVTFTPATGFIGTVSIPYLVADDQGQSAQANLKATVLPPTDPPPPPATVDVYTTVSAPTGAPLNGVVNAILTYGNQGTAVASGVRYSVTLPAGLSGVGCSGATCSYDSATGVVTVTGLPDSLSPGQTEQVVLSYTATTSGTLAVQSTIGTTSTDSNPGNNSASASTQVPAPAIADVAALVDAPAAATAGSTVAVDVTFINLGTAPATGVSYTITLPPGLTGVGCAGATCSYNSSTGVVTITGLPDGLAAGQTTNLTLSYTAPASGSVTVTASTNASNDSNSGNNSASDSTAVSTATTADVTTTVAAPATAVPGSPVAVPVTFGNLGPAPAAGMSYSLALPPGLTGVGCGGATCSYDSNTGTVTVTGLPGTLAPGQTVGLVLSYTAPTSGSVTVTSTAGTSTTDSNPNNNSASASTAVGPGTTDVYTTVTVPSGAPAGGVVHALITYGNQGSSVAMGATYTINLATGLTGVGCGGATCSYDSNTGIVTVTGLPASLSPGQTEHVLLSYTAPTPASGTVTLPVTSGITTTSTDSNPGNNTATGNSVVPTAAIADVTVWLDMPPAATPGSTVNVPVTFINLGTAPATGVSYAITLPPGLTGVGCGGATCSYDSATGVVTVTGLPGTLAPGQTVGLVLSYTAPASGSVTVTAGVDAANDSNPGNNSASDGTAVSTATTADVTTTVAAPATAAPGSPVAVPVTFGNLGPAPATGVSYAITLPPGLTGVGCGGATCSYDSATGVVTVTGLPGTLAPGQTVGLVLSYTAPASGSVTVTSTITTNATDSNPNNNSASGGTAIIGGTPVDIPTLSEVAMLALLALLLLAGWRNIGQTARRRMRR